MKVKVAIILLLVAFLELTECARPYRVSRSHRKKKESYDYNFDYDTAQQQGPAQEHEDQGGEHGGGDIDDDYHQTEQVGGKSGYSEGSGLRSIAQGSADQANSAVANQHLAAKQASYIAQNNLANLALQASATAMAALQGKQVLLAKIEQENLDAHQSLENELQQLRQAKRSAKAAQQSAAQAMNHLTVLQSALNNAQTSAEHAQQSANEASAELASQTNMVGKAKQRVEQIEETLHQARIDYEATVKAANDAQASAQIAQNNAAEAAAKASITSLHDIHSSIPSHSSSTSYEQEIDHGDTSHYGSESSQHKTIAVPHKKEAQANNHPQQNKAQNNNPQQPQNKPQHNQPQQTHGKPQHNQPQHNQPQQNQPQHNQPQHNQPQQSQNKPQHSQPQQKAPNKDSAPNASSINVKQIETIASNHNYGSSDFRPSKQYSFAGY